MYHVSIELYTNEWKFGRTNAVGTRAAGECFHGFFEFSQTFTSVCMTRWKHGVHVFYFKKQRDEKKGNQLVNFDYQNVNSLRSRHHYVRSVHIYHDRFTFIMSSYHKHRSSGIFFLLLIINPLSFLKLNLRS